MLEEYKLKEPFIYKLINKEISENTLSHAYLIDTSNTTAKDDFALEFSKVFLCPNIKLKNCENCSICSRINKENYNELNIIKPDGLWIKKEQLKILKEEYTKTSLESKNRVYVISECEKMNTHAANGLLKFLEEPEAGVVAILLTDYPERVLETIRSRCQIIKLRGGDFNFYVNKYSNIENKTLLKLLLIDNNFNNMDNLLKEEKYKELLNMTLKIIYSFERKNKLLIYQLNNLTKVTEEKNDLLLFLDIMIYFYKDIINLKNGRNIEIFENYFDNLKEVESQLRESLLIKTIKIIIDTKENINYNMNSKLLIDKLFFELNRR